MQKVAAPETKMSMRFEYLLQEMADCRQDDRDSITQILSVVAAGIAALVIVLNVLSGDGSGEISLKALVDYAPLILAGIVATAFSYMLSLGLRSTLRYQYMRMLSDELKSLSGIREEFMGWTEISAPLITLNPRHIKSVYTAAYFGSVLFAVTAAAAVCVSLIAISAAGNSLGPTVGVLIAAFFVCFVVVMVTMSDSKAMMAKIQSLARERRETSETAILVVSEPDSSVRNWLAFARYLLYPHPQDLLKVLFAVFGFIWGCFLADSNPFSAQSLCHLALLLIVFDVLGYQARYQINDIRGYGEDKRNPAAKKRGRLNSFGVPEPVAIYGSAAAALVKVITGAVVVTFAPIASAAKIALGVAYALIFAIAVVYELSRARRSEKWPFRLVGLGYPLRIGAGAFFALGAYAPASALASSTVVVAFALVLTAAFLFGWSFVGITWLLECCAAHYSAGYDGLRYHKAHVERLRQMAISRDGGFDPATRYYPLLRHDSARNVWNWSLAVSVVLMLAAGGVLSFGSCNAADTCPVPMLFLMILSATLLLVGLLVYIVRPGQATIGTATLALAAVAGAVPIVACCRHGDYVACASPAVLLAAIVYVLICLSFKGVNYFEMADFLGGVKFGVVFGALSVFGLVFRWPEDDRSARDEVKQFKEGLTRFNHEDMPETSERCDERKRRREASDAAFRRYVNMFRQSGNS